jgi:hypothetical protein
MARDAGGCVVHTATWFHMALANVITVEASIASFRIDASRWSNTGDPAPTTPILLTAVTVQDHATRALQLVRLRHLLLVDGSESGELSPAAGSVEQMHVSITLGDDAVVTNSEGAHARTTIGSNLRGGLLADWSVVMSLLWGGARVDSLRSSAALEAICCRMVTAMLRESIRFHWILEQQPLTDRDGTAVYRIVDAHMSQL